MLGVLSTTAAQVVLQVTAAVLQLVGAVLVIRDVRRSGRISGQFDHAVTNLTNAYNELSAGEEFDGVVRSALFGEDQPDRIDDQRAMSMSLFGPMIATDLRTRYLDDFAKILASYNNATNEPRWWVTWIGPAALLAGIAVGLVAGIAGI